MVDAVTPSDDDTISRVVIVDRNRPPQEALDATGRTQYGVDRTVVDSMPRGKGILVEVVLFRISRIGRRANEFDVEHELKIRHRKACDPYTLMALNEDEPELAYDYPNFTHWQDENGKWSWMTFSGWDGAMVVCVQDDHSYYGEEWWVASLPE